MDSTTPAKRVTPPSISALGSLLKEWRSVRRLSQMDLALEADVSPRHLSCVETGKAQASRELIARLADVLAVPLRERNALLLAAGYAPEYRETDLDTPELLPARRAVEFILAHQEPYPAFLLNRRWDVLRTNRAAMRVVAFLRGGSPTHTNILRQFFDPHDLRAVVVNWEEVAGDMLRHLHDEIAAASDPRTRALLEDVLSYPGVPSRWQMRDPGSAPTPLLTVAFRKDGTDLRFFSTITAFGTPRDVTLEDLRIECAFPADETTAELCRALAREDPELHARMDGSRS